jgi:predicted permease
MRVAGLSSVPAALATVAAGFLALLLALVSVVLVIACANVAGVLLARAVARRREIAVRMAIGAGRRRLIRQLLTETMLLFMLGGAAGVFLARWMTSLIMATLPAFSLPVDVSLPLDARVLAFTAGLAFVAAVLSGLAPALHVSKTDVVSGLKHESTGPSGRLHLRNIFVVAQVTFSIVLVIVAGLLVKALTRVSRIDLGFDPGRVETAPLDLSGAGYAPGAGAIFARDLIDRIRSVPGVETASLAQWMPGRGGRDVNVLVPGSSPPNGDPYFTGTWSAVDADYFATLRIPILAGRSFTSADQPGTAPVVIVNDTAAQYFWPGRDPIGRMLEWHDQRPGGGEAVTRLQVIGVARALRPPAGAVAGGTRDRPTHGPDEPQVRAVPPSSLMMYVPFQQRYSPRFNLLVRARGDQRMASEIRKIVRAMDANLPMSPPEPLDRATGPVYFQLRMAASVAGGVGLAGLLLAAIGIYGLAAYTTALRTREIGIRVALGAHVRDVVGLVLRQGLSLVLTGTAIGLVLAMAASRLFVRLLFGMPPLDPPVFAGAALLFAAVGVAACFVPARRAARVDAMEALRAE